MGVWVPSAPPFWCYGIRWGTDLGAIPCRFPPTYYTILSWDWVLGMTTEPLNSTINLLRLNTPLEPTWDVYQMINKVES